MLNVIVTVILLSILILPSCCLVYGPMNRMGPNGMDDDEDMTTCDGFSKHARFNPLSLVGDLWYAFYHWSMIQENIIMKFFVPTTQEVKVLQTYFDLRFKDPINWTAKYIVMKNLVTNITRLIVERNDRGWYWMYPYIPHIQYEDDEEFMEPTDVRFKQTGDNQYWSLMICKHYVTYVFSRLNHVPLKRNIQDIVSRMNHRQRRGKSYLYQGHEWAPIPERNEAIHRMPDHLQLFYHMYDMDTWDGY